jgi:acyl carrier protein
MPEATERVVPEDSEIMERVITIVAAQMKDVDEAQLHPSSTFIEDLGVESLDTVEIVLRMEEEFDITLAEPDVAATKTIQDAVDCVRNRLVAAAEEPGAER